MRLDSDILFPCYLNIQLARQPRAESFVTSKLFVIFVQEIGK
jgi:hypothetical protein